MLLAPLQSVQRAYMKQTASHYCIGVLIDPRLEGVVLPLALFYGGIAQFIAGLFEYKIPNTFGATAFCRYCTTYTQQNTH